MGTIKFVTQAQVRAARSLLGLTADELATLAGLGVATVRRFEAASDGRGPHETTLQALRVALEAAGVEFIPENGGGAGVRLAKRSDGL